VREWRTDVAGQSLREQFPADFVWGTATAAYQIEGAATEDGRGASIWDTFTRTPGRTARGETGDVACDHYHRWPQDLDLGAGLGVDAYRLSLSWPRILPTGAGRVESRGLDFYRRLLAGVRERGLQPYVTLYHWDLPQALEDGGGWRSRDTAQRFAEYAAMVANALAEFEPAWITLNEPYCSAIVGYAEGKHAPGAREGHGALAAAHHLLLAHGLAVEVLRPYGRPIGVAVNLSPMVPVSTSDDDVAAARRRDLLHNRLFLDPLLRGRYPADYDEVFGGLTDRSFVDDGDLAVIGAPLDFLGVNYYYRNRVRAGSLATGPTAADIGVVTEHAVGLPLTQLNWPVEPEGLHATLARLHAEYPGLPPVYITENGCAYAELDDQPRIAFVAAHLAQVRRAIADGIDVSGYFYWSLLDNLEWARGYEPRFGLVHVDYATQARTPRASYTWLRDQLRR
jgi:beta-glucosidase